MMRNITVYGAHGCSHTNRAQSQLRSLEVGYEFVNVESDPVGYEEAAELSMSPKAKLPVVVIEGWGTRILCNPDEAQLLSALTETKVISA
jgi:glutaredoxin